MSSKQLHTPASKASAKMVLVLKIRSCDALACLADVPTSTVRSCPSRVCSTVAAHCEKPWLTAAGKETVGGSAQFLVPWSALREPVTAMCWKTATLQVVQANTNVDMPRQERRCFGCWALCSPALGCLLCRPAKRTAAPNLP